MTTLETSASADDPKVLRTEDWTVVHDFVFANGGAEAVTRWLCNDVLPASPLLYLSGNASLAASLTTGPAAQLLPKAVAAKNYRLLAATMPVLVRAAAPLDRNLLISSYAFAAGMRSTGAKVIYCHSPLRQAWSGADRYAKDGPLLERLGTRMLRPYFQHFDSRAAASADKIIATSTVVRDRIHRFYHQDAEIIPPPVDGDTFYLDDQVEREDFFVWAGRITEPYKQLGIVLEAFKELPNAKLVVVGEGRDRARLERQSSLNVRFVGWQGRSDLADLYRRARALIFPSEDDFGLVPVEAMSCGTPVIAYAAGGALDTVEDGRSGILFHRQAAKDLLTAIRKIDSVELGPTELAEAAAKRWGRGTFQERMRGALLEVTA